MDRTIDINTISPDARLSAQQCADFMAALLVEGFENHEAILVVAAWMGRPPGMTPVEMNAVMENMVEKLHEQGTY